MGKNSNPDNLNHSAKNLDYIYIYIYIISQTISEIPWFTFRRILFLFTMK